MQPLEYCIVCHRASLPGFQSLQQFKELISFLAYILSTSGKEYLQGFTETEHQTGCNFGLENAIIMLCLFICFVTWCVLIKTTLQAEYNGEYERD